MTNLLWRQRDAAPPPDRRYRCSLESLACDRCHFIEGEPADAIYCGSEVEPGKSYCSYHCGVVYKRPDGVPCSFACSPATQQPPGPQTEPATA